MNEDIYSDADGFRDTIATVDEAGKRIWIYPKRPSGRYHQWRILVTVVLLSLFFAGPFLTIGGQPLLLLNIFERKFVLMGQVFWPQDFFLLAVILLTFFVFIILFTVVFGRIWCGWMCPQTLFMEMVFRKIEYWIEGDAPAQRRLREAPWTLNKALRKFAKHSLFILISLVISHTAMAYIIGVGDTLAIVRESPWDHVAGFGGLIGFTIVFYAVFAKFREQACIAVCPYGRLQGVLLVKDSIVVAYDWLRGEPRGRLKKTAAPLVKQGDCIDCKLCVHVCPTGIDIRNGTQLECINCTACIDACDEVMVKIGKPKGLIRYASYTAIQNGVQRIFTPRVAAYTGILATMVLLLCFGIVSRSEVETRLFKVPGTLYQRSDDGAITNLYNIEFVNKTFEPMTLDVRVESPVSAELRKADGGAFTVQAEGFVKGVCFIRIPPADIHQARTVVTIGIYKDGERIDAIRVKFIGPVSSGAAGSSAN